MIKNKKPIADVDILPIDTPFWECTPVFTNLSMVISWEILTFFMGTTNRRSNFAYYAHLLTMISAEESVSTKRGIDIRTKTCEAQLSLSSLESIWGMKRKQACNMLDRMEQLGLVRRTSDNVSSVVNLTNIWGLWSETGCHQNLSHIRKLHELKLDNDKRLAMEKAAAKSGTATAAEPVKANAEVKTTPAVAVSSQTASQMPSETSADVDESA